VAGMAASARPYQLCEHQSHEVGPLLQQGREQLAGGVVGIFVVGTCERPLVPARRRLGPIAWYIRTRRAPVARASTAALLKGRKEGGIGGRGLPRARTPPLHLEFRVPQSSVRGRRLPARTSTAACLAPTSSAARWSSLLESSRSPHRLLHGASK